MRGYTWGVMRNILLAATALAALTTLPAAAQAPSPGLFTRWTPVGVGLEDASVTSVAFDKDGVLHAGLKGYGTVGAYRLRPGSAIWERDAIGLGNQGEVALVAWPDGAVTAQQCPDADCNVFLANGAAAGWSQAAGDKRHYVWQTLIANSRFIMLLRHSNTYGGLSYYTVSKAGKLEPLDKDTGLFSLGASFPRQALSIGPSGTLYATSQKALYRSQPNAPLTGASISWSRLPQPADAGLNFTSVIEDAQYNVFVANGMLDGTDARTYGVYKMGPTKTTWKNVTANLPESSSYELQFDSAGNLYSLTAGHGVWVLPAQATQWLELNRGLAGDALTVNQFQFVNGVPYIATNAGVYIGQK